MKLRLIEQQLTEQFSDQEELNQFILTNCQPYLKESNNQLLYRGTADSDADVFIKPVRRDREPMSSSQFLTDLFNEKIKAAGKIANRNNAMFCTGNRSSAWEYGHVFAVFPIGMFDYTWSPTAIDWYRKYSDVDLTYKYLAAALRSKGPNFLHDVEFVLKDMQRLKFVPEIDMEKLQAMTSDKQIEFVRKLADLYFREFFKASPLNIKGDDGSLPQAIDSGHEIMVSCEQVLYVRPANAIQFLESLT